MSRVKRGLYRLLEVFDYRTFAVAAGFLALLLVGYLVMASVQQAHDATEAQNRSRTAATRRIDILNNRIEKLQAQIVQGQGDRSELAAKLAALEEQVRQLGGRPVVTGGPARTSGPVPGPTRRPSPTPAPTSTRPPPASPRPPSPTPRPSPTCLPLPVIGCLPGTAA